jgi:hypothetical protein
MLRIAFNLMKVACPSQQRGRRGNQHRHGPSTHRPMEVIDMSTSNFITEPEQDMLAWYRLGSNADSYPLRQIATIPVSREPLADDTSAELIDMPMAA